MRPTNGSSSDPVDSHQGQERTLKHTQCCIVGIQGNHLLSMKSAAVGCLVFGGPPSPKQSNLRLFSSWSPFQPTSNMALLASDLGARRLSTTSHLVHKDCSGDGRRLPRLPVLPGVLRFGSVQASGLLGLMEKGFASFRGFSWVWFWGFDGLVGVGQMHSCPPITSEVVRY